MMKRGLTLIELLVVVAVVAILAAIAVPNFLEASMRANVSRTKADLRTIATGLESYFVDINRYPPDAQFQVTNYLGRLQHLTTPVAYLTTLPTDPFANEGRIIEYVTTNGFPNAYTFPFSSSNFIYPLTYDYACAVQPNGQREPQSTWERISSQPDAVQWSLRGVGPDKWPEYLGRIVAPYDPTNGTVSEGNIFWSGPGIGEDIPALLD